MSIGSVGNWFIPLIQVPLQPSGRFGKSTILPCPVGRDKNVCLPLRKRDVIVVPRGLKSARFEVYSEQNSLLFRILCTKAKRPPLSIQRSTVNKLPLSAEKVSNSYN